MKPRFAPKEIDASLAEALPIPISVEQLRKRRYWLVVVLTVVNCICLFNAANRLVHWRSSVSLILPKEQVTVLRDTAGAEMFEVRLPLNEFPYEIELEQQYRFDLLGAVSLNLLLLAGILHSYWRQSRLERKEPHQEPAR
jgi:hypothetical protein